jgi:hypothetical protein
MPGVVWLPKCEPTGINFDSWEQTKSSTFGFQLDLISAIYKMKHTLGLNDKFGGLWKPPVLRNVCIPHTVSHAVGAGVEQYRLQLPI